MPIQNAEELFITTLSHLHSAEMRTKALCDELAQAAQEPEVKSWLEFRSYMEGQQIANIEQCFKMLGKQPVKTEGKWVDVFAENFRNVWNEIQAPKVKALYLLHTIRRIQSFHMTEYATLALMAEFAGYPGVAALLELNREEKIAFIERTKELVGDRLREEMRGRVREQVTERMLKRVA